MTQRKSTRLAVVLLALGVVAGCSLSKPDDQQRNDGEPPLGQLLNVTDLRSFALPLDPYRLKRENLLSSNKAEHLLTKECMARFGFNWAIPEAATPPVTGAERRYGLADQRTAESQGYHNTPIARGTRREADDAMPPAAKVVLTGEGSRSHAGQQVPDGGCLGEARRKLAAGAPEVPNARLGDTLATESYQRTLGDSRVRAVNAKWSACMKRAGHDYADPSKANNDAEFAGPRPTARELTVAVADVRCKVETNLINIMASVESAYQRRALERNAETLAAVRKGIEIREVNGSKVLLGR